MLIAFSSKGLWIASAAWLVTLATLLTLTLVQFLMKTCLTPFHAWGGLFIFFAFSGLFCVWSFSKEILRAWSGVVLLNAVCMLFFIILSLLCYDFGWDGQYAHQSFIFFLSHGWNPLTPIDEFAPTFHATYPWLATGYFNGSLRGMGSILSATLVSATGYQESGKAINLLFTFCAFGVSLRAWRVWGLRRLRAFLLAGLMALNPVALSVMLTYSLDSHVCALLASLVALALLLWKEPTQLGWLTFAATLFLLALSKISGLGLALILGSGFCALLFLRHLRHRPMFLVSIGVAALMGLIILIGTVHQFNLLRANLKETNLIARYRSVFEKYLNPSFNTRVAPFLKNYNPFERLAISLFSQINHGNRGVLLKIPFAVHKREITMHLKLYEAPEIGGFGPWMGGGVLLSFCVLALCIFEQKEKRAMFFLFYVLIFFLFVSAVFLPMWLARYVPQLWLIPVLCAGLGSILFSDGWKHWLTRALLVALIGNVLIIAILQMIGHAIIQPAYRHQLRILASLPQPITLSTHHYEYAPLELRLKDYSIGYILAEARFSTVPVAHLLRTEDSRGIQVPLLDLHDPRTADAYRELQELDLSLKEKWIMLDAIKLPSKQVLAR